jgi:hypothetical protein
MNPTVRNVLGVAMLTATLFVLTAIDAEAQGLGLFRVEGQAQQHCPNDSSLLYSSLHQSTPGRSWPSSALSPSGWSGWDGERMP